MPATEAATANAVSARTPPLAHTPPGRTRARPRPRRRPARDQREAREQRQPGSPSGADAGHDEDDAGRDRGEHEREQHRLRRGPAWVVGVDRAQVLDGDRCSLAGRDRRADLAQQLGRGRARPRWQ